MTDAPRYQVLESDHGVPIKAWTIGVPFDPEAQAQLRRVASLPFLYKWVAAMPDVHAGKGATIGSVIASTGAVIPAAVGVDIGCGMMAVRTDLSSAHLTDNLRALREAIERAVPHGRTDNGGPNDRGAWLDPPEQVRRAWDRLRAGYEAIIAGHSRIDRGPTIQHLGTLGTGNHFIEVCLDEHDGVWVMLHSGSRGVGNRIGTDFIELAKADMKRWFIQLPDADLAYLPEGTEHFDQYMHAVQWAQDYAATNRELMMQAVLGALAATVAQSPQVLETAHCHHNYVARENHFGKNVWVTRKGAVRARPGDVGIIPGSMGARSYIVQGLGDAESFHSCSHGAGRKMSRNAARKTFTLQDHAAATSGIECRKDVDVLDETPGAYKAIDDVMNAQKDLVKVIYVLQQAVCIKG